MADVAFLLIVFFIVTLTFSTQRGLDLGLPEEDDRQEVETVDSVLVEVLSDGRLLVDRGERMTVTGLLAYLEPKLHQDPDKPVIVRAAPETGYGLMVDVLDELRQGRVLLRLSSEINIALPTEREILEYWGSAG
jgi:biopolymer transport protein ExbD